MSETSGSVRRAPAAPPCRPRKSTERECGPTSGTNSEGAVDERGESDPLHSTILVKRKAEVVAIKCLRAPKLRKLEKLRPNAKRFRPLAGDTEAARGREL